MHLFPNNEIKTKNEILKTSKNVKNKSLNKYKYKLITVQKKEGELITMLRNMKHRKYGKKDRNKERMK